MIRHTHRLDFTAAEVHKHIVRWDDGEADREWACLTLLAEHAPGIAPQPLRREEYEGAPVIVMERLPGSPLPSVPASDTQILALGEALRAMYAIPAEVLRGTSLLERRMGPSSLCDVLKSLLSSVEDLDSCEDPLLVDAALQAAREHVSRATLDPVPPLTAIGIADLNPANVLWDGNRCRLVDFEDGGLTFPAFELADHIEHIGSRLYGVYDADALVTAAGFGADERALIENYRILWAIFWLAMLLPGRSAYGRNPRGTLERQARWLLALIYSDRERAHDAR
jgi:Ser/Thr protein kinase RdoA (MazF antagonist)